MRVIIVGGGALGQHLAKNLIDQGYEIILIERNAEHAKVLAESFDCTIINAEGTKPEILEKAEIEKADAVVACTDNDQNNILIGLIARSSNTAKIIVKTNEEQFMAVARKLGFRHIINPSNTSSMIISDVLRGVDTMELSNLVRSNVRFISIIVGDKTAGKHLSELPLPSESAFVGLYRESNFILAEEDPKIKKGDELVVVTNSDQMNKIYEQFDESGV